MFGQTPAIHTCRNTYLTIVAALLELLPKLRMSTGASLIKARIWKKINYYFQYWFCTFQGDHKEESTWRLLKTVTEWRVHLPGHTLSMTKQQHPKTDMKWTPPGECRGRHGNEGLKNVGVPWEDVENVVTDWIRWRTLVTQCAQHSTWWWCCEFIHNRRISFCKECCIIKC